jgi:hypothetical protein
VFWGYGWQEVGTLFISWNLFAVALLVSVLVIAMRLCKSEIRHRIDVLWINIVLYGVCILPFILSGALAHGWMGGYVTNACDRRIDALEQALIDYAQTHEGRLPVADQMDDLLPQIEGLVSRERIRYSSPIEICPVGAIYEREPKSFRWNRKMSNKALERLDPFESPFECPYHQRKHSLTWSSLIFDRERRK